jgi:DNA polymerase-3 subunit delta'
LDCCDQCRNCRQIDALTHPDVLQVRPESKTRIITIDQMRDLMATIHLKPTVAEHKVALIAGADRLNPQAANAFLKTLEEPPANSILLLLTTEPQRILETILSRCLRLTFAGQGAKKADPALVEWLGQFARTALADEGTVLGRYRLLSTLVARLNAIREEVARSLGERSPLERFDDIEPKLRERWEEELAAAIESEYRRRRGDLLAGLQGWFRDVWLETHRIDAQLLSYPDLAEASRGMARRLDSTKAGENLEVLERTQRLLYTNVQEALALEVGLLQLQL